MAYEIIGWKNKGETGAKPINRDNLRHMDNGILNLDTYKAEIMPLLTVSDTAPVECERGDLYYNTTTELIYVATQPDTWSEEGTTPSTFNLYVDLSSSKLYYYDGTNFNSYGSGDGMNTYSTNEIRIGTWIDNKPIYRKVIEINKNNLVSGDNYITYDFSTTGTVTNLELMYERQYHLINKAPANTTASNIDGWYVQLTADKDNNRFIIALGSVLVSRINNGYSIWILLEYTKTTD